MYRTVADFVQDWSQSVEGTTKVLQSMTDDKLDQAIVEGHSTLGWLGWHLATAPILFANMAGVKVDTQVNPDTVPDQASTIVQTYQEVTQHIHQQVEQSFTDEHLLEEVDGFGTKIPRGAILRTLIDHQTHHRGQMTVLLRQAGLTVPSIMGPTQEEQEKQ